MCKKMPIFIHIPPVFSQVCVIDQMYMRMTPVTSDARHVPIATVRSDFSKNPNTSATPNPMSAEIYEPVA